MGETSRSLYERGKEHWRDFRDKLENSHILKHHLLHHGGNGEPKFHLQPVRFFRTVLTRQVHEAVRIQAWGESTILNSKADWEQERMQHRRVHEVQGVVERGVVWSPSRKRNEEDENNTTNTIVSAKKQNKSKNKYPLLDENWDEEPNVGR